MYAMDTTHNVSGCDINIGDGRLGSTAHRQQRRGSKPQRCRPEITPIQRQPAEASTLGQSRVQTLRSANQLDIPRPGPLGDILTGQRCGHQFWKLIGNTGENGTPMVWSELSMSRLPDTQGLGHEVKRPIQQRALLSHLGDVYDKGGLRQQRSEFEDPITIPADIGASKDAGIGLDHLSTSAQVAYVELCLMQVGRTVGVTTGHGFGNIAME
jgi:hypothetical protein